jgi:tyrosyl-DNA phosphodiesterase 2
MRRRRAHPLPVGVFDEEAGRWVDIETTGAVTRPEVTVATYNIWFSELCADQRHRAVADVLAPIAPDVMVFQEVTPSALEILLAQRWIRERYLRAAMVGGAVGNYGMLMLSRLPVDGVTYTGLPTRLSRGYLRARFTINGATTTVCSVHLDSGKRSSRLRRRQLRVLFRALATDENAVVMGDFNMRDDENAHITGPFRDVWPLLRPDDAGYTEDTTINLMRYDMKDKHRHVRFDRVLLKGPGWTPTHIDLLGTEPVPGAGPRIFPSDHFGVVCRLAGRAGAARRPAPRWRRLLAPGISESV